MTEENGNVASGDNVAKVQGLSQGSVALLMQSVAWGAVTLEARSHAWSPVQQTLLGLSWKLEIFERVRVRYQYKIYIYIYGIYLTYPKFVLPKRR